MRTWSTCDTLVVMVPADPFFQAWEFLLSAARTASAFAWIEHCVGFLPAETHL